MLKLTALYDCFSAEKIDSTLEKHKTPYKNVSESKGWEIIGQAVNLQ